MTKDVSLRLIGEAPQRLWGMEMAEWQRRAWTKAGASGLDRDRGRLVLEADRVLSPALQRALLAEPGAALMVEEAGVRRLVALHLPDGVTDDDALAAMVGQDDPDAARLSDAGCRVGGVTDFAGDYDAALRKREAPYALSLGRAGTRAVEARLFRGSYKGVTDLVTKYAWPWPAFHATRACAVLGISPNTVTTASLVLVGVAFWLFWTGAWLPGIVAAWAMTFLDTVDGKLARTTMSYSRWGDIYDHGIDLIHPPFWYWAIWQGVSAQPGGPAQGWLDAALAVILAGYVLNRVEEGLFIKWFGFHIHVWRPLDSFAREITARRNPNMVIFTVAVLLGAPGWGLVAVAGWTLFWLVFHAARLGQARAARGTVTSWMEG
ncbi:CDP-alcohol phosphatidyltransferase family protein [Maritimibacter sp. 55A14]|uniref:CDP-alcohol phosphatidyltransferase family protein n=1 Tax=Maritimibacter sp. 55A14 TaxID=2174844 RepID=UPI001E3B0B00|nr:CDP-alcohol phosphatidyltransferase family protein [Maritimibacter sp. 55A14]